MTTYQVNDTTSVGNMTIKAFGTVSRIGVNLTLDINEVSYWNYTITIILTLYDTTKIPVNITHCMGEDIHADINFKPQQIREYMAILLEGTTLTIISTN